MKTLRRILKRLASRTTTQAGEDRLHSEMAEHLALETGRNIRTGLSPTEERRQALLKFGAVESIREDFRDQRTLPFLNTLLREVRYCLRRLRKAPVFSLAAIFTLALGIGATTSVFTIVHAIIFESLAVADPNQLYRLGKESRCCYFGGYSQPNGFSIVSYDLYLHLRDNTTGFPELAAFSASMKTFGVRRRGVLQMVAEPPHGLEHLAQGFVVTDVVANQIRRAHDYSRAMNWPRPKCAA